MDNTPVVEQKIEPVSRPTDLINDGGLLDLIDTPVQQQQAPYIHPTLPVQNFSTSVPSYNNNIVQQQTIFATANQSGVFNFFDNSKPQ